MDGDRAGGASRAEHAYRLAGVQFGPPAQCEPGAEAGVAERGGDDVVDALGDLERRARRHQRSLAHGAIRCDGLIEVHAPAVGQASNAVGADNARQRRWSRVVRAGRLEQIEMVKTGRRHLDEELLTGARRLIEFGWTWRSPVFVKHGRTHETQFVPSPAGAQAT